MNLVSMCLYGSDPIYRVGVIENAKLMSEVYPHWRLIVWMDNQPADLVNELILRGAIVMRLPENECVGIKPMFHRFLPASWGWVDRVVIRDADSRINWRESSAVREWEAGDKAFHVMRDHPHHADWPMLGGMWGCKGGAVLDILDHIERWGVWKAKLDDMAFLQRDIWPLAQASLCHHSSVPTKHPDAVPFPTSLPDGYYVGQVFDADNKAEVGR